MWSSEPRSGLYHELSLAFYKVAKLIKKLPACMMIKHFMGVLSPAMVFGTGAMTVLVNLLQGKPW